MLGEGMDTDTRVIKSMDMDMMITRVMDMAIKNTKDMVIRVRDMDMMTIKDMVTKVMDMDMNMNITRAITRDMDTKVMGMVDTTMIIMDTTNKYQLEYC